MVELQDFLNAPRSIQFVSLSAFFLKTFFSKCFFSVSFPPKLWHISSKFQRRTYGVQPWQTRKWRPKPEMLISVKLWQVGLLQLKFHKTMYRWKIVLVSRYTTATDNRIYQYGPQTGNNFISGTLTDDVEITTPNSGFSMMTSSTKD